MTNEELVREIYGGNKQAVTQLYEQNIGYIRQTAIDMLKKWGLDSDDMLEDLVQTGSVEMIAALRKGQYNPEKSKFLTYITPYLKGAMQRHLEKFTSGMTVTHADAVKIRKCRRLCAMGNSEAEIAAEVGISESLVVHFLQYTSNAEPLMVAADDEENTLIQNPKIKTDELYPDETVNRSICVEQLKVLFHQLSAREQQIIGNSFGVFGYQKMSLEDMADFEMVSVNTVLNIRKNALDRLKTLYVGSELARLKGILKEIEHIYAN